MNTRKKLRVKLNKKSFILIGFVLVFALSGAFLIFNSKAAVTCDYTYDTSQKTTFQSTVNSSSSSGKTICLQDGDYGQLVGNDISKSSTLTIRSVNSKGAKLSFKTWGGTSRFTFQDLTLSGIDLAHVTTNMSFLNNKFVGQAFINLDSTNSNILIDSNTFDGISVTVDQAEGRLSLRDTGINGDVGITVSNNHFGTGGCSDGIQTSATGVIIKDNEFDGILQGNCAPLHVDPLQLFNKTTVSGNYFHDNSTGIMACDGGSNVSITNNVFANTSYNAVCAAHMPNLLIAHNVLYNNGAFRIDDSINHHSGESATTATVRDNIGGPLDIGNTYVVNPTPFYGTLNDTNNLFTGAQSPNINGSPKFASYPSTPTKYADFKLASDALSGKNAATDNTDVGINISISPPVSQTANLWVDTNGGTCVRQATANSYGDSAACASFQAAWSACQPGDTIIVKSSATSYGAQSTSGAKASPGCTIQAEAPDTVTVSSLNTGGGYLTIKDITVDVGLNGRGGWSTGSNVTAINLKLHGGEPNASIQGVTNVIWDGGELGQSTGGAKARDFCNGSDEPVTIASSSTIKVKHVTFWPQTTGTNNACNHMENFRIDGTSATPTNDILLEGNFFKPGDGSNTARIFITTTSSNWQPTNIKIQNNYFGGQATAYDIDVHADVTSCSTFTIAYNTLLGGDNAIQCSDFAGMKWIGNAGGKAGSACRGIFTKNVWVSSGNTACSSDKWVSGNAYSAASALGVDANGDIGNNSPAKDAAELAYCTSATGINSLDRYSKTRPAGTTCDAGSMEFGASSSGGGGTTTCSTKQGDTNGDNAVNILDISAILSSYGQTGYSSCNDVTKDGSINIQDISLVLSKYGT